MLKGGSDADAKGADTKEVGARDDPKGLEDTSDFEVLP